MLFVLNESRGQGVSKALFEHAIKELKANMVDVNERNPFVAGFYEHMGFKIISRSGVCLFQFGHGTLKYAI